MMRFAVAAAATLSLLAACSSIDRANLTEFQPMGDGTFRYEAAAASIGRDPSDPIAEAERMRWLETYLADNTLCPAGYEITDRTAVLTQQGLLGDGYRIYYTGTCK